MITHNDEEVIRIDCTTIIVYYTTIYKKYKDEHYDLYESSDGASLSSLLKYGHNEECDIFEYENEYYTRPDDNFYDEFKNLTEELFKTKKELNLLKGIK